MYIRGPVYTHPLPPTNRHKHIQNLILGNCVIWTPSLTWPGNSVCVLTPAWTKIWSERASRFRPDFTNSLKHLYGTRNMNININMNRSMSVDEHMNTNMNMNVNRNMKYEYKKEYG